MVNVQCRAQTFRGTPSSSVKARKNVHEERKKCHLCTGRRCEWGENGVGKTKIIIIIIIIIIITTIIIIIITTNQPQWTFAI